MALKLKKLRDQVIVVTGASSGIGLTTAELAAERGAAVMLNARNEMALRTATERIRSTGGRAAYFTGDVADDEAMDMLAQRAIEEFGGFDTWINNAGVGMYGRLVEMSMADKRRLFDVDFWGVVNGCRSAVRHLRSRGGVIINIGSVASDRALPLLGLYAAAKHAVKGYTDALRMELEAEGVPISVSLVKPSSINTPFTDHARNYMEEEPEYAPPVYAPESVARAILKCAERPIRDVTVGAGGRVMAVMGAMAPRLTDTYMEHTMFSAQKRGVPAQSGDSLDRPQSDGRRRGRTTRTTLERSGYTRAAVSDVGRMLPVLALGAMVAAGVRSMRHRENGW